VMDQENRNNILRLFFKQVAVAAAIVAILAALTLTVYYLSGQQGNIQDSPVLTALKAKLEKYPDNEKLLFEFRDQDLKERTAFFRKSSFLDYGKNIFIVFFLLALAAFRLKGVFTERLPEVKKGSETVYKTGELAGANIYMVSSGLTAVIILGLLGTFAIWGFQKLPFEPAETEIKEKVIDLSSAWNGFRGPAGTGLVKDGNYVKEWDIKTGKNIIWQIALPVKSYSSPVVYKDNLFLTGSEAKVLKVSCYDAKNGSLKWSSSVMVPVKLDDVEIMSEDAGGAGYAAPTTVTDGELVFAFFATDHLVCFDYAGKQRWVKYFGKSENTYGLSSSPLLWKKNIILQLDRGGEGLSKLVSLDRKTGQITWETKRPVGASWGTPAIIEYKGKNELITTGEEQVISYDPDTGKELWRVKCLTGEISTSPVYGDGKIIAIDVGSVSTVSAIIPGGAGDVTKTNIVWSMQEENQAINTPVTDGKLLVVAMNSLVVGQDIKTGKVLWKISLEDDFWASPSLVNGTIYVPSQKGKVYIVSYEGKLLGTMDMDSKCSASPAFVDGKIFIRSEKNLFCIGTR